MRRTQDGLVGISAASRWRASSICLVAGFRHLGGFSQGVHIAFSNSKTRALILYYLDLRYNFRVISAP